MDKIELLCEYADIDMRFVLPKHGDITEIHKWKPDLFIYGSFLWKNGLPKGMTNRTHLQKMFKNTVLVEVSLYEDDSDSSDFVLWTKDKRDEYEKGGKSSLKNRLDDTYLNKICVDIVKKIKQ